jgi:hypothetical protein
MSFVTQHPLPPEADAAGARARLDEFIRREFGGSPVMVPPHRPAHLALTRWALAAAAVLAVAVGLWRLPPRPGPALVRGGSPPAGAEFALAPVETGANGDVTLRWGAQPQATRYEVRFYCADLSEAMRRDAGTATTLSMSRDVLSQAGPAGGAVMVRVVAYRDAAELAQSPFAKLALP